MIHLDGNRLTLTPRLSGGLWTTYQLPRRITVGGGLRFTDAVFINAEERQRWTAKLKPMEEDWVKSMDAKGLPGRHLLSDLREAIKKYDP